MGKIVRVSNGTDQYDVSDTDLPSAAKDGYLPTEKIRVINSKTNESYDIDPKDYTHALKDGFNFSDIVRQSREEKDQQIPREEPVPKSSFNFNPNLTPDLLTQTSIPTKDQYDQKVSNQLQSEGVSSVDKINEKISNSDKEIHSILKKTFDTNQQALLASGEPNAGQLYAQRAAERVGAFLNKDNSEHEGYKASMQADEAKQRKVLHEAGIIDPSQKKDIDAAVFLHDHQHDIHSEKSEDLNNALSKVKSGEYNYDVTTGKLTKPTGTVESIVNGWKKRKDDLNLFDEYMKSPKGDDFLASYFDEERKNANPYLAEPKPSGVGAYLGGMAAENAIPMLKGAAVSVPLSLMGQPEAGGVVAAAINTPEYANRAFINSYRQSYNALLDSGVPRDEAISRAKHQATIDAVSAGAQGALQTYAGAKLGGEAAGSGFKWSAGFKPVMKGILKEGGEFGKEFAKSGITNSAIIGGLEVGKNVASKATGVNRKWDENVGESMGGNLLFELGLGAIGKGFKNLAKSISPKEQQTIVQNIASQPTEKINETLGTLHESGDLNAQEVENAKNIIDTHKIQDSRIPESVIDPDARVEIKGKLDQIDANTAKLKKVEDGGQHDAFNAPLKDKNDRLTWEVNMLSAKPEDQIKILKDKQIELQNGIDKHNEAKRSGDAGKLDYPDEDRAQLKSVKDKIEEVQTKLDSPVYKAQKIMSEDVKDNYAEWTKNNKWVQQSKDNPEEFLKMVAEQSQGEPLKITQEDGNVKEVSSRDRANELFGKDLVNAAEEMYPKPEPSRISVTMPGENKSPDAIIIKPNNGTKDAGLNQSEAPIGETNMSSEDKALPSKNTQTENNVVEDASEPPIMPPTEQEETVRSNAEENQRLSGISEKVQKQLGIKPYEKGKGWSPKEAFDFGRAAIDHGVDPVKVVSDPTYANLSFGERLAVAQAHHADLVKEMYNAGDNFGTDSKEFKEAANNVSDYQESIQHLKTESSKAFTAQQGAVDIDTDSFTAVTSKVKEITGRDLNESQKAKVKELTDKNRDLQAKLTQTESKLKEATDNQFSDKSSTNISKEKISKKLKDVAARLRTSDELDKFLKGSSGPGPTKMGLDLGSYKEIVAGILEETAKIIEKGEDAIAFIKKSIDAVKEDVDKEKLLKDVQLIASKIGVDLEKQTEKPLTENEIKEQHEEQVKTLQGKFVDKKDNKFTADEAKDIWSYAKANYLDKGINFRDMISNVSNDLGLSFEQVSNAITTPKTKRISDAMWKYQYDLQKNRQATQRYVDSQGQNAAIRAFRKFANFFRETTVFGHGGVFVGTHAGMTLMDLPRAKYTVKSFFNAYKLAYGKDAYYEKAMNNLKSNSNYELAQRAGLKNNPDIINNDAEIIQPLFGRISESGKRGFNAIKVLRQDLFDSHYNALSAVEKADPGAAKSISEIVNNATGASNLDIPKWVNEVTFAGGMEAARWGKLTRNPAKATVTAIKAIFHPKDVSVQDRVFAKIWAKRVGTQVASYFGLLTLNAAIQNSLTDDPKKKVNLFDPTQSDWLKMKIGNTTFDFTSGMMSTIHFIEQLAYQSAFDKTKSPKENELESAAKTTLKYGIGKLSPFYGDVVESALRHDYQGNTLPWSDAKPFAKYNHKLTWAEYGASKLPLPVADYFKEFYESAEKNGLSKPKIDNILTGLKYGAISGTTGFKAYETAESQEGGSGGGAGSTGNYNHSHSHSHNKYHR
jgi:hypothetical protein